MNLLFIWATFILVPGLFPAIDELHYILFSLSMFYFTYIYNRIYPLVLTPRILIFFLTIPNVIFWYIGYHYNDFLLINPITEESFIGLMLIYSYIMVYIASEWD